MLPGPWKCLRGRRVWRNRLIVAIQTFAQDGVDCKDGQSEVGPEAAVRLGLLSDTRPKRELYSGSIR